MQSSEAKCAYQLRNSGLAVHDEKWRQNGLEFVEHLISGP